MFARQAKAQAKKAKIKMRLKPKAIDQNIVPDVPQEGIQKTPTLMDDTVSIRLIFSCLGDAISKMLALEWARYVRSVLVPPVMTVQYVMIFDEAQRQELARANRSLLMVDPTQEQSIEDKFLDRYQLLLPSAC